MENELLVASSVSTDLPAMVRNELGKLSAEKQAEFNDEYQRKAKAFGWGLFLAFLGWHYAYLRNWGLQLVYWLTGGGLLIWWFVDLFRVSGLVKDYNKDASIEALRNVKMLSS